MHDFLRVLTEIICVPFSNISEFSTRIALCGPFSIISEITSHVACGPI